MTIVFELITIISLLALTVIFYLSGETKRGPFDTQAETMWTMRARRVGPARWCLRSFFARGSSEKIRLEEGTLIVGNRLRDECYIDDTGERVKLFFEYSETEGFGQCTERKSLCRWRMLGGR